MDIRPDYANVVRDGKEEEVDPDEVAIGETIVVKPGENSTGRNSSFRNFYT
jgi:Cd2+/Zn2+-exporting ATPase